MKLETSCFSIAERFLGFKEVPGVVNNPHILAMLRLDSTWPESEQVPWCSAFTNYVAWLLNLPRSKSLAARSWLTVGRGVGLDEAEAENDVVILSRGSNPALGHVGFYAGRTGQDVLILGGNQADAVSVQPFVEGRVLAVRRLA